MGSSAGPRQPTKGNLIFAIDAADFPNSAMPLGGGDSNGVTQGMRSNTDGLILTFTNGLRLTNRDFYTGIGISYPEGNYGGDAANRQGLTPGFNVRSGGKTYDASRSLNFFVWHRPTSTWIEGYFNGARISGHCYDNWAGAENGWENEMIKFVADYNNIKSIFDDCIYVLIGSHACQMFRQVDVDILVELGAPRSVVNGWTDNSAWREFVLVGKPGLQDGKAFGWAYQNYPTNPDQVAHLNFGIPRTGTRSSLEFDGSNDYLPLASNLQAGYSSATYEFVCNPYSLPGTGNYHQLYIQENSTWIALYSPSGTPAFGIDLGNGSGWFDNNGGWNTGARTTATISANRYYHVVYTWEGAVVKVYLNGVLQSTTSTLQAGNGRQNVTTLGAGGTPRNIGSRTNGGGNNWHGAIDVVNFYNRSLSATEVTEQYNNYKTRFGI